MIKSHYKIIRLKVEALRCQDYCVFQVCKNSLSQPYVIMQRISENNNPCLFSLEDLIFDDIGLDKKLRSHYKIVLQQLWEALKAFTISTVRKNMIKDYYDVLEP